MPHLTHVCPWEVSSYEIGDYDEFFILASDGIWEMLSSDQVPSFRLGWGERRGELRGERKGERGPVGREYGSRRGKPSASLHAVCGTCDL